MNADTIVKNVEYYDLQGAVAAAVKIIGSGEKISMENFEQLSRKAGDEFVTALNSALVKAGLAKE